MTSKLFITTAMLLASQFLKAQVALPHTFDLTAQQPIYNDNVGYGYDKDTRNTHDGKPFYFSVKVPDGNYRVTVELGSKRHAGNTTVRAESRRLMVENCVTKKKETKTMSFIVNKRTPYINDKMNVRIKEREKGSLTWDDRLTLEFNGPQPAVKSVTIEPDTTATTIFLCGNSTVVDQNSDAFASWGQMAPRWFDTTIAISNHAESGLSATSFLYSNRLEKVLATMRKGDYVLCEFGHNDQKEKSAGAGAWYKFQFNLKSFIDQVRAKGGTIVFVTPTQRRRWDNSRKHIVETHGDYPDAMRDVARRENVPLIELHDLTRTFFETLGFENSKRALVHYPANTFPTQTRVLQDNTHFNGYGAYEVSKMVVMEMKRLNLDIVKGLRSDWKDYSPSQPDDFNTFVWPIAPISDMKTPDGN